MYNLIYSYWCKYIASCSILLQQGSSNKQVYRESAVLLFPPLICGDSRQLTPTQYLICVSPPRLDVKLSSEMRFNFSRFLLMWEPWGAQLIGSVIGSEVYI